jgi:hypothetical protein
MPLLCFLHVPLLDFAHSLATPRQGYLRLLGPASQALWSQLPCKEYDEIAVRYRVAIDLLNAPMERDGWKEVARSFANQF